MKILLPIVILLVSATTQAFTSTGIKMAEEIGVIVSAPALSQLLTEQKVHTFESIRYVTRSNDSFIYELKVQRESESCSLLAQIETEDKETVYFGSLQFCEPIRRE